VKYRVTVRGPLSPVSAESISIVISASSAMAGSDMTAAVAAEVELDSPASMVNGVLRILLPDSLISILIADVALLPEFRPARTSVSNAPYGIRNTAAPA
jgi:hypothetical protein